MRAQLHKHFRKQVKKLSPQEQQLVQEKIELFVLDPYHSRLRNHPLKGKYLGYRSIDIRPDVRALYRVDEDEVAIFTFIGSHSQLYK